MTTQSASKTAQDPTPRRRAEGAAAQSPLSLSDQLRRHVRTELIARGIPQAKLARHLDITEQHMSNVLLGKTQMSLLRWDAAAELLGLEWVVGRR